MPLLKVLHIITRLDRGGSSTNTIETVARLDKKKYVTTLLSGQTHDPDGKILKWLQDRQIDIHFESTLIRSIHPFKDLQALWRLHSFIKQHQFDIVHTHSSKAGILGRWAARWAGVKTIVHTPHGHVFYGYFHPFVNQIFIWVERITALITDKMIVLTQRGKSEHIQFKVAQPDKFIVIYSGIDIDHYGKTIMPSDAITTMRQKWGVDNEATVFGCVARLDAIKGHRYLVDAFRIVYRRYPQTQLILVGDGEVRDEIRRLVESYQLQKAVLMVGEQNDIPQWLQVMDVFVLASLNEGMGRVILEAMACGKPVIASKTGGIPELVEDGVNGKLFSVKDVDELAAAMMSFCQNSERAVMISENNRRKVSQRFSLDQMVRDIDDLYIELLKKRKLLSC